MRHRLHLPTVVLAVGLPALGTSGVSASGYPVPFTVTFSGTGSSGPTSSTFVGTGNASHMGRISSYGVADHFLPDTSCPGGVGNVNTETFTAANGDQLTIVSQDVACPVSPGVYHGTGHWTVCCQQTCSLPGGTGRFADATGEGSFSGSVDFNTGASSTTVDGAIQY